MNSRIVGALYLSLAAGIWGGMYVVSKYVLDYMPPITLVWFRYVIAFVLLYFILKQEEKKNHFPILIEKKDWLLFTWIGFIGYFLSVTLQFMGTRLSDAHTGALLTSTNPVFTVIFARWVLKEPLYMRKVFSLLLATVGVLVVIGWNHNMGGFLWGNLLLVGAAITWALLSVYVKVASRRHSSLTITTYSIFFALLFTTPFMIGEASNGMDFSWHPMVILGILYLGIVSTAGAFFLWNKGMALMEAGVGSLFFFFQPIVGALLGWTLLGEQLTLNFYLGGGLILLGILLETSIITMFPRWRIDRREK